MKKVNYFWGILIIAGLTLGLNGAAYAIPCGLGGVSGSIACSNGPPGDSNDQVADLISGNYFGFDDWEFLQKQETPGALETTVDIGLSVLPLANVSTGTWSFNANTWSFFEDLVIVLKDGNQEGVYWSAYRLDNVSQPDSGTWDTGGPSLSHLTVYGRGDGTSVPEPATMLLLGTGLIALGLWGWGRKRSNARR